MGFTWVQSQSMARLADRLQEGTLLQSWCHADRWLFTSRPPEPSPVLGAGVLLVKRRILKTEADVLDDGITKMGK